MAQIGKQKRQRNLKDAKIYAMTADTGVSPTYSGAVDILDVVKVGYTPQIESAEIEGDDEIKDIFSRTRKLTGVIECNAMPLDALAILIGGTVTQTPETTTGAGDSVTDWSMGDDDDEGQWFKLESLAAWARDASGINGKSGIFVAYRCKVTGVNEIAYQNNEFAKVSVNFTAIRTHSDKKLFKDSFLEKAGTLSA